MRLGSAACSCGTCTRRFLFRNRRRVGPRRAHLWKESSSRLVSYRFATGGRRLAAGAFPWRRRRAPLTTNLIRLWTLARQQPAQPAKRAQTPGRFRDHRFLLTAGGAGRALPVCSGRAQLRLGRLPRDARPAWVARRQMGRPGALGQERQDGRRKSVELVATRLLVVIVFSRDWSTSYSCCDKHLHGLGHLAAPWLAETRLRDENLFAQIGRKSMTHGDEESSE